MNPRTDRIPENNQPQPVEKAPQPKSEEREAPDACRRCGTCCRKGGPALHLADSQRVISGALPLKDLFTIRPGEPVFDNISGQLALADTDIVKIRAVARNNASCRYFVSRACTIYEDRPVQCRALACWDTRAIQSLYRRERLTRRDLLAPVAPHWIEMIAEHEVRCSYTRIARIAADLTAGGQGRASAAEKILSIVRYDDSIRQVLVEKAALDRTLLAFLFGRPLTETLPGFGLRCVQRHGSLDVETVPSSAAFRLHSAAGSGFPETPTRCLQDGPSSGTRMNQP